MEQVHTDSDSAALRSRQPFRLLATDAIQNVPTLVAADAPLFLDATRSTLEILVPTRCALLIDKLRAQSLVASQLDIAQLLVLQLQLNARGELLLRLNRGSRAFCVYSIFYCDVWPASKIQSCGVPRPSCCSKVLPCE